MPTSTMRTTINLPANLLQEAKIFAAENQTTLTELLKQGLRKVLGHNESMKKKQTLLEYLESEDFKPYPKLTDEERERRYREAMTKKHG
jgi:ribosomal protein L1